MDFSLNRAKNLALANGKHNFIVSNKNEHVKMLYYTPDLPAFFNTTDEDFVDSVKADLLDYVAEFDKAFLLSKVSESIVNDESIKFSVSVKNRHKGGYISLLGTANYLGYEAGDVFLVSVSHAGPSAERSTFTKDNYRAALSLGGIHVWDFDMKKGVIIDTDSVFPFWKSFKEGSKYPQVLIDYGLIKGDDINTFLSNIERLYKGEKEVVFDIWYHFENGKAPRYIRIKYILDEFNDANTMIAHGMSIDLTEKKIAESDFANRTKFLLKNSPDTIVTMQLNLTTNKCNLLLANNSGYVRDSKGKNADEILELTADYISSKSERASFMELFSRKKLAMAANVGNFQIKNEHHLKVDNREEWVLTTADVVVNPISLDIEAFIHITNIHKDKVISALLRGTVRREYDFIALIYLKTDKFFIIDKYGQDDLVEKEGFKEYFRTELLKNITIPSEKEKMIAELDYDSLSEKIEESGIYLTRYNTHTDFDKNHHHILRFSFVNSQKNIIVLTSRDVTSIHNSEQKANVMLSKALDEARQANNAKSEFLSLVSHSNNSS